MLPIKLTKEVCTGIEKDLCEQDQEQYLNNLWSMLQAEDGLLAASIKKFAATAGDPAATIYACVLVWRLIERQAQSDNEKATSLPYNGPYL